MQMNNFLVRFIIRYFFKILYSLGLTFVILFLTTANAPTELGLWKGTSGLLALISLVLIVVGVIGVYHTCRKSWQKMARSLGLWTLIPGLIALLISLYGLNIIYSYLEKYFPHLETVKPIIDVYINRRVPKIWILTASYIFIGSFLYITGLRR